MDASYWKDDIRFDKLMATDMILCNMLNGEIIYYGKFKEGLFDKWWNLELTGQINFIEIYYATDILSELVNKIVNFKLCIYPTGYFSKLYHQCDYNLVQMNKNIKPDYILAPDDIVVDYVQF